MESIAESGRSAGQGLRDPLAVALYRAAILEADRILRRWGREGAHDPGRFTIGDVLELERTLERIAAELVP